MTQEGPIKVTREKCTGCGICVSSCPFGCINLQDEYPVFSDDCRLCSACVEACPQDAISIREVRKAFDVSQYSGVLVFAEQRKGVVHPVAYELLGKGRELADQLGEPLYAVLIGSNVHKGAEELAVRGANKVYLYEDAMLADIRDDPYSEVLTELVKEVKPSIFLVGATATGRSLGPKVAAKLGTGLTADCTGLEIDTSTRLLMQTRPAFGGNIMATIICPDRRPQMATVRYKVMLEAKRDPENRGEIVEKRIDAKRLSDRVKILDFTPAKEELSIVDADIIVSGGKGIGEARRFEMLGELAQLLGGAVGASRPTVDEGWIEYTHQVGLSGRTVRPKLYMACGISGAVQHQAGMKTSDYIISVNKDKEAPIHALSTLGVVGDCNEVIPFLIEKIRKYREHGKIQ